MVNYFKQLTLPWLIAVAAMALTTGLWYHFETQGQQRVQIQQFSATLQLSLGAFVNNKDQELLRAQLNHIRYASAIPLHTVAVYNQSGKLLAATDSPPVLQHFKAALPVRSFSLQQVEHQLLALQPLTQFTGLNDSALRQPDAGNNYYLLLLFTPQTPYSVWLIPVAIVGIIGWIMLVLIQGTLSQAAQRLHTDISLLVHKLSQLKQGQLNARVDEELVAELLPLKQSVNDLAAHQTGLQNTAQQQLKQQQQLATQAQAVAAQLQQQNNAWQLEAQMQSRAQQRRLISLQQLQQQSGELTEDEFSRALSGQITLMQLELNDESAPATAILLTDFVAAQIAACRQLLASRGIELQLIEGSGNVGSQVRLPLLPLSALLQAMVQLGSRSEACSELTLAVRVAQHASGPLLQLSVTTNGEGISARVRQLLSSNDIQTLQWHESDIGILVTLKKQLSGQLSVQSLDGLGSTIALNVPLAELTAVSYAKLQHVLLFDANAVLQAERIQSLSAVAANVAACSDLSELTLKSTRYAYELVLLFLPEPGDLAAWQQLTTMLAGRSRVLCYCAVAHVAIWREALNIAVETTPFCLAALKAIKDGAAPRSYPHLLVVDDNPTNLAYIRVLMKTQPVQLSTVSCGAEALKLCRSERFDVVLLDIQLPDIKGTEVAMQLRQLAGYQQIPILAFTAHALEDEVAAYLQAGMNDVIFKPLEPAKLQQVLSWCSVRKTDDLS